MLKFLYRRVLKESALSLLVWAVTWGLLFWLDSRLALANLAMLLVLAAALASLWRPVLVSFASSLAAVLAFNWFFVPPRGSFSVDGHQHALLLLAMFGVSSITATLMARLRSQAALAARQARQAEQLRAFSDRLRDGADPQALAPLLQGELQTLLALPVRLMLLKDRLPPTDRAEDVLLLGDAADADQSAGLWQCLRHGHAFGPGTGRYDELNAWYLPLRGRSASHGAALIQLPRGEDAESLQRAQAQSFCDQMGLALERLAIEQSARQARVEAADQTTRNALLAAISHDYRTPLACIMSAASALQEQDSRLSPTQRGRLTAVILDETEALSRMTANSLQLARLDAPGVALRLDWESAEEIVGAVLRRVRQRRSQLENAAGNRLRARLEPGLPLLRCDALLLSQLLENLVDNALKYGSPAGVEVLVRSATAPVADQPTRFIVLAVRDRGPGVAPAWRERIFEVFQRGTEVQGERPDADARRGAGVGLAACRAIARAHGGDMRVRARSHGGASFECWLPEASEPQPEPAAALAVAPPSSPSSVSPSASPPADPAAGLVLA
jgi:two-component system sensor histidine kinase KdpD